MRVGDISRALSLPTDVVNEVECKTLYHGFQSNAQILGVLRATTKGPRHLLLTHYCHFSIREKREGKKSVTWP